MLACQLLSFFVPFHGTQDEQRNHIDVFAAFQTALEDPVVTVRGQAPHQVWAMNSAQAGRLLEGYQGPAGAGAPGSP